MSNSPYLISVKDLAQQTNSSNLVIIDTRFSLPEPEQGHTQYKAGHIPGAYYLDLNRDLSSPVASHGGRHPLPNWSSFVQTLNTLGITSEPPTQIVVYDDSRFAFAARLWWMLRYLGHEQVSILDGGVKAWEAAGLPLSTEVPPQRKGNFTPGFQTGWIVDIEQVKQRAPEAVLIDSRSPERYRGEVEPIDPIAGSIPGAINAFWQDITTDEGFLKDTNTLSEQWSKKGVKADNKAIVYCGSGVTACVNLFALVVIGYPMHKLYPGGWSDWCTYAEREQGDS